MLRPCAPASVSILLLPQLPIVPAVMRVNRVRQQGIANAHRAHHANRLRILQIMPVDPCRRMSNPVTDPRYQLDLHITRRYHESARVGTERKREEMQAHLTCPHSPLCRWHHTGSGPRGRGVLRDLCVRAYRRMSVKLHHKNMLMYVPILLMQPYMQWAERVSSGPWKDWLTWLVYDDNRSRGVEKMPRHTTGTDSLVDASHLWLPRWVTRVHRHKESV